MICIGLVFLFAPTAARAASPQQIEAAKKEGKVVLYTTIDLDEMAKFHKAFVPLMVLKEKGELLKYGPPSPKQSSQ